MTTMVITAIQNIIARVAITTSYFLVRQRRRQSDAFFRIGHPSAARRLLISTGRIQIVINSKKVARAARTLDLSYGLV